MEKYCGSCQVTKPTSEFNKSRRHGYQYNCKIFDAENKRQWRENNRGRYNEYFRKQNSNNNQYKIAKNIPNRIYRFIKLEKDSTRTEQTSGCNRRQLLILISLNFEGEMCFQNYGKTWELDHVNPLSNFNLALEEELLAASNWENIRPCFNKPSSPKTSVSPIWRCISLIAAWAYSL